MARSNYAGDLNEAGDFEFEVSGETIYINYRKYGIDFDFMNEILLKARLCFRHSNSVKYFFDVLVDKTVSGINAIIGHTCNCEVGQRVVGCFSHVVTLFWFFGKTRFLDIIPIPAQHLSGYFDMQSVSESEDGTDDRYWTYSFQWAKEKNETGHSWTSLLIPGFVMRVEQVFDSFSKIATVSSVLSGWSRWPNKYCYCRNTAVCSFSSCFLEYSNFLSLIIVLALAYHFNSSFLKSSHVEESDL